MDGAANRKANAMTPIFTLQDLRTRTLTELHILRRKTLEELAQMAPGSTEYRSAQASLDAINRMLRIRMALTLQP